MCKFSSTVKVRGIVTYQKTVRKFGRLGGGVIISLFLFFLKKQITSQASKASQNKAKIPAIIAVVLMGSIFFGLYYFNNVYVGGVSLCKETMTNSLKSPGSAKFGGIEKKKVLGVNYIRGYVDSQNGFSALVRTYFVCMPIEGTALIYTDSDRDTSDYNRYNDLFEEGLSDDAAINIQKESLDQSMNKLNSVLGK